MSTDTTRWVDENNRDHKLIVTYNSVDKTTTVKEEEGNAVQGQVASKKDIIKVIIADNKDDIVGKDASERVAFVRNGYRAGNQNDPISDTDLDDIIKDALSEAGIEIQGGKAKRSKKSAKKGKKSRGMKGKRGRRSAKKGRK
jgi:hypothetical protein